MTDQMNEWQGPLKPWYVVEKRFFDGQAPNAAAFAQKYSLDEAKVRRVFDDKETTFSPEFCAALSQETGMSELFFRNLSDRYQQRVAA